MAENLMGGDLLEDCLIRDLLTNADDAFLFKLCLALSIVARRTGETLLVQALEDAMGDWAVAKGFCVRDTDA